MNALAFSDTKFFFSKLIDHGEKESKTHDLVLEKLQRAKDEWNKDRMKRHGFINRLRQRIKQEHTSTILMKQYLSAIEYLQNK